MFYCNKCTKTSLFSKEKIQEPNWHFKLVGRRKLNYFSFFIYKQKISVKMFLIVLLIVCVASSSSIATCKNGELIVRKQAKDIRIDSMRLIQMKCICVNDKFPFTKNTCSVPPVSNFKKIYMCDLNAEQWMFQQNECLPLNHKVLIIAMFFAFIIWGIMRFIC